MKKRKSQITLFIILGLLLFFIIGFLFYLTKYVAKKQTGYETTKTQKIKTELQPIENYVTQCLDKVTKEGLVLLGKQGGYLYTSQGGTLIDFMPVDEGSFFVNYDNHRVSYGIYPLRFDIWPYYSNAPEYPWEDFPSDGAGSDTFVGLFGISNLPPINSSFGANSIKSQLELYIKNNIKGCIDLGVSDFEEQGYEITENKLSVNLGIAKEDLTVRLTYPLTIKNKITDDTTSINDFFVREKVRLEKIHDFTYNIINNDITDIKFNISKASGDGFSVQVIRDVYDKDDVIIVRDLNSLINNKPYEFVFARHNRMPALYYLYPTSIDIPCIFPCSAPIITNDTLNIPGDISNLKAIDPDEDTLTFSIESVPPRTPPLPTDLNIPTIKFYIKVADGELEDYQIITVNRVT